ncbi:hypothetical protein M3699_09335 [Peribacillus simplex]|uniref:hypothetical protein n=1 Tax=Peribacillus simplex TaxID=1478 RepID=UPI002041CC7D|nr:hypothetical protein [Peribacillus simplex]MCM3674082.1 hypothetical protein [Peribacillus simplex]
MDEMRKKIIIQEINSRKESRMLPEQYCNYLNYTVKANCRHQNRIKPGAKKTTSFPGC